MCLCAQAHCLFGGPLVPAALTVFHFCRFNTHPNTPTAFDCNMDLLIPHPSFVPLIRTEGWSDQNHMARTDYYRDFVMPAIDNGVLHTKHVVRMPHTLYS